MPVSQETAERIGNHLIQLVKGMLALRDTVPRVHPSVDFAHYPVLFSLCEQPQRITDLAERLSSDVSTVSRQVTHLAAHDLVEKIADPHDGRAQQVSLTPDGHAVLDGIRTARGTWIRSFLTDWEEADAARFADFLDAFRHDLMASAPAPAGRPDHHRIAPSRESTVHGR